MLSEMFLKAQKQVCFESWMGTVDKGDFVCSGLFAHLTKLSELVTVAGKHSWYKFCAVTPLGSLEKWKRQIFEIF